MSADDGSGLKDEDTRTRIQPALDAPQIGQNGRDRACLIVLAGMSTGEVFKLESRRSVIGRSPKAEVHLTDEGVSREHAAVCTDQLVCALEFQDCRRVSRV